MNYFESSEMLCEDERTESFYAKLELEELVNYNINIELSEKEYLYYNYIYDCNEIIKTVTNNEDNENNKKSFRECQLCYGNNMYYVIFNESYSIPYCSSCGEYPTCNFKYSKCNGKISTSTEIIQYFISPILTNNKNHMKILFNKFINIIDINKFNHAEFKIKLRILDIILNTKFTKMFLIELVEYILTFLVDESLVNILMNI
jgi:hypothetical protein